MIRWWGCGLVPNYYLSKWSSFYCSPHQTCLIFKSPRQDASDRSPSMVNGKGQEASAAICCLRLLCLLSHSFAHLTRCKLVQPADNVDDVLRVSFPAEVMLDHANICEILWNLQATNSNKQHKQVCGFMVWMNHLACVCGGLYCGKKTGSNCRYVCGLLDNRSFYTGCQRMQRCLHINKPMYISLHVAILFLLKGQRN